MNQETTGKEPRVPLLYGWLGSIALHGLLLLSCFPLFGRSLMAINKEPFHWDVTLVHSAEAVDELVHPTRAAEPTVSRQPDRASLPARPNHKIRHIASQTGASVKPAPRLSIPSSAESPAESATASKSDEPAPDQSQSSDPPLQQADPPIGSTTQEPRETVVAASTPHAPPAETAQPSPAVTAFDSDSVSTARPDYGWLQQAIFRKLEELKRSSRPSLDESRPLKVTVKAVVSREGMLLNSAVVKSSGLDRIDQEAMALVQRAFPLQLDRALDRRQIVLRIPITYSQE